MRSGGVSTALQKQQTILPRLVYPWHYRLYFGCTAFSGIFPTTWGFPQCLPMAQSYMSSSFGELQEMGNSYWTTMPGLPTCCSISWHGEVSPNKPSPSRVTSPTSSVALYLPASSHSRTPSHGTNIVRSHSISASSASSQTVELKLPAGSGDEGSEDSPPPKMVARPMKKASWLCR